MSIADTEKEIKRLKNIIRYACTPVEESLAEELLEIITTGQLGSDIIRDANRYRFLRDEDAWGEDSSDWDPESGTGLICSKDLFSLGADSFDIAVDARMIASEIPFFNKID